MKNAFIGYHWLFTIMILLCCFGCERNQDKTTDVAVGSPPLDDIPGITERVMTFAADQPERAIDIVDSLRASGFPAHEADWLLARVYSQSLEGKWLDSAIVISERLIKLPVADEDLAYREDVLETLVNASRLRKDDKRVLLWTRELITLCRQKGEEVEALRNEAEMAVALSHSGNREDGLSMVDSVLSRLDNAKTFNAMDAWIIASKRKMSILKEMGSHSAVIPLAHSVLSCLDRYEQHPDEYRDGSYREPSDDDRNGYIDFYRAQAFGFLSEAYAHTDSIEKSVDFLSRFERSYFGKTLDGRKMIAPTWCLLGEDDKLESMYDDLTTARFQSRQQQMEIEEQKIRASASQKVAGGLAVIVLLLFALMFLLHRQHRIINRKNKVLTGQIIDALEYKKKYWELREAEQDPIGESPETVGNEKSGSSDDIGMDKMSNAELFEFLSYVIRRECLFLDSSFGRQTLTERFHLSPNRVGAAFSLGDEHSSLPGFIRNLRLEHACLLLIDNPEMSIDEVATASGFANYSVFARYFKQKYDITPSEYRRQQQD